MKKLHIRIFAYLKKTIRITNLALIMLLIGSLQMKAISIYAQTTTISINVKNESLENVLKNIEEQSEFLFFYNANEIDKNKKITLHKTDCNVTEVLDEIYENAGIYYLIKDRHIVLTTQPESFKEASVVQQDKMKISGVVYDEAGETIIGASVAEKGTKNGTVTNIDGQFSLTVSPDAILQISYIGYTTQEISIKGKADLTVTLKEDDQTLDEVVVVGYGSTSKRKMVSSVSTIDPKQIENLPSSSVINNLGGRTPGVLINAAGGGPNSFSSISIRGGEQPLVVIDGVITDFSDFRHLNQNDIENISILKDASATAIYGARAADGIVLVTTKRGSNKPLTINYNFSYSWSQPTVLPKKISSYERALYANEGYANDGRLPRYDAEQVEKYRTGSDPFNYPNTDWQKETLKDFAPEMNHNLSFSGGDKKNSYYASLGYFEQGSLYIFDTNKFKRYNARLSMVNNFEKIGLRTTTMASVTNHKYHSPWEDYYSIWGHMQNSSPMDIAYTDLGYYSNKPDHPIVEMDPRSGYKDYDTKVFNGQFQAEWSVPYLEGFKLKSQSHIRMDFSRYKGWQDSAPQYSLGSEVPGIKKNPSKLNEKYSRGESFTQQFLADYDKKIEDFTFGTTFGSEFTKSNSDNMSASRENYQIAMDQFDAGPTDNMKNDGKEGKVGRAAIIGRLKADYRAKYLIEATFRHDGSDLFPKGKRWGTFYSVSGGWVASDENFMRGLQEQNILNVLKLKASHGLVGLDSGVERYEYVPGYGMNSRGYVIDGKYVQGFSEGLLVSKDITWYSTKSTNLGFDFTSLNGALFGGMEYYYMRTTGLLGSPSSTEYTDPLGTKLPKVRTNGAKRRSGYEFYLGYKNNIGDFEYEVSANFTKYEQLWENNPDENENDLKTPNIRNTHQKQYNRLGYKVIGFYKDEADVQNSPHPAGSTNLRPGDLKYADIDGNGIIDAADRVRIGRGEAPKITYGINIDLKYKGIFMSALFQGNANRDFYLGNMVQAQEGIVYPYQTNYWTPTNTDALYPRLLSNRNFNGNHNYHDSDFWLVDASYFRLKALQIGYDFKRSVLKNVPVISNTKLILSGTNLFTISKSMDYYYDPESGGEGNNYNYPYQRVYSLTLNIGF